MNNDAQDYFDGFQWAIPKAFKDALAACRFEQGDTLYNTQKAYETSWENALKHLEYAIRVELPVRGLKNRFKSLDSAPSNNEVYPLQVVDDTGKRNQDLIFTDNWNSDVSLSLTTYPSGVQKTIKTTQGHLYMTLWKGDIEYVERSLQNIIMPRLPKDSRKNIPSIEHLLLNKYTTRIKHPQLFIMPTDETRDVLWSKYRRVKLVMDKHHESRQFFVKPVEINLPHATEYLPTLRFAVFVFDIRNRTELLERLKEVLYVPSRNRKTAVDRFKLETHGYIFPSI